MKDEDAILRSGDEIHFILYRDHAIEMNVKKSLNEFLKEIRDNPHILWVSGKILNPNDKDPFYIILCDGAFNRLVKPTNYVIVQKNCIIKKEVIFTIP